MNIVGLNNQSFGKLDRTSSSSPAAPEKGASFESALGQAQSTPIKGEDKLTIQRRPDQDKPEAEANSEKADGQNAESLPTPGGLPSPAQPTPVSIERGVNPAAVNPAIANALNNKPVAAPQPEEVTSSLTRRVVWNDFLRKMGDIGVSADDIVQAFSTLNKDELGQAPEQSVDKIVMALGLDSHQANLARQAFNDLLQKTKAKSFGDELQAPNRSLNLTALSQAELQRKSLQHSLENLNRDFFMNRPRTAQGAPGTEALPPELRELAQRQQAEPMLTEDASETKRETSAAPFSGTPVALPELKGIAVPQALAQAPAALSTSAPNELSQLAAQMKPVTAADKKSVDELIRQFNGQQPTPAAAALETAPTAGLRKVPVGASAAATAPAAALGSLVGIGGRNSKSAGDDSSGSDDLSSAYQNVLTGENRLAPNAAAKGEFQAQLGPTQNMPVGVPELMQQAHVMIREGGGEMKVTLHPDGLGEVAMRVSVDGNKVNVQMITESDEAKKLIERQIGELKSGLTANHLQVESIKVDTASNLGRQLEQQMQDGQRHQAQANLEQFRQDHQGWRRSFFESGTVNPYVGQAEGPGNVRASGPSAKSTSQRRLDLVA
jgi:flagellar hook-length control protein FliK